MSWLKILPPEPNGLGSNSDCLRITSLTQFLHKNYRTVLMWLLELNDFNKCKVLNKASGIVSVNLLRCSLNIWALTVPIRMELPKGRTSLFNQGLVLPALNRRSLSRVSQNPQNHSARQTMLPSFYRGRTSGLILISQITCPKLDCHSVAQLGLGLQSIHQSPRPGFSHQATKKSKACQ